LCETHMKQFPINGLFFLFVEMNVGDHWPYLLFDLGCFGQVVE
jgi:hypothetical protein